MVVTHTLFTLRRLQILDEFRAYVLVQAAPMETRKIANFILGPADYTASRMEPELLVLTRWFGTIRVHA
jgi:hypothetical protein